MGILCFFFLEYFCLFQAAISSPTWEQSTVKGYVSTRESPSTPHPPSTLDAGPAGATEVRAKITRRQGSLQYDGGENLLALAAVPGMEEAAAATPAEKRTSKQRLTQQPTPHTWFSPAPATPTRCHLFILPGTCLCAVAPD
jgi:hypothetical protein